MPARRIVLVSILLSVPAVWAVAHFFDASILSDAWSRADANVLGLAFLALTLSAVFKTLRWQVLDPRTRSSILRLWCVTVIHNMASHLLPANVGELVFPALQRHLRGARFGQALGVVAVGRALDVAVLAFALTAIVVMNEDLRQNRLILATAIAGSVACVLGVALFRKIVERLVAISSTREGTWRRWLGKLASMDVDQLVDGQRLLQAAVCTLVTVVCRLTFYWLVVVAIGFAASPLQTTLAGLCADVAWALPTQTFANIGTQEAGWTLGATLAGLDATSAVTVGVVVHAVNLLFAVVLGLSGIGGALGMARLPGVTADAARGSRLRS